MSPRAEDRGGESATAWRSSPHRARRIRALALPPDRRQHGCDPPGFRRSERRSGAGASRMRLDETGAFDLDASAFLHGKRRAAFEDALRSPGSTARNAWIFLGLGALFFLGWLYRLMTMTWTANATLTALQFTPACAVFFLLAFRFGLENYQIRMRRKVTAMEYLSAARGFWPR